MIVRPRVCVPPDRGQAHHRSGLPDVGGRAARGSGVVGVHGAALDLIATTSGCAGGTQSSLLRYNPVANTFTVLLGPPVNGGSVLEELPYPGQG